MIRLEAENFKRLRAVELKPNGQGVTVIGGANGAGKSSVLDAIQSAIGGKHACPVVPVHTGERKATIVCELDGLVIKRTFTEKGGGTLTVTDETGKLTSPQKILDALYGSLTFDPLTFCRMGPSAQRDEVQRLAGVDLSDLEATRATLVTERTDVRRDLRAAEKALDTMPRHDDAPDEPRPMNLLLEELQDIYRQRTEREAAERELLDLRKRYDRQQGEISEAELKLVALKLDAEESMELGRTARAKMEDLGDAPDPEELQAQIDDADAINAKFNENQVHAKAVKAIGELELKAEALASGIGEVDYQRQTRIAAAELPVENMAWGESGVTLHHLPFSQASQAEQLRASVGMGIAANPDLRLMLIRDGSLLDDVSMELLAKLAEEFDMQVLLERVGDGDEMGVIIEDGAVRG